MERIILVLGGIAMQNKMTEIETIKKYFIQKARTLSLQYNEQIKTDSCGMLGDILTEDIANEWMLSDLDALIQICQSKEKADICVEIYKAIDNNFSIYSRNNENIWNLDALKNHPFWEDQRKLACKLLDELMKS